MFTMLRLILKQFKIFYTVICAITVYMMDNFLGAKITSEIFLHYQTVLKNISFCVSEGMIRSKNTNIPLGSFFFATFPCKMFFARHIRSFNSLIPRGYSFAEFIALHIRSFFTKPISIWATNPIGHHFSFCFVGLFKPYMSNPSTFRGTVFCRGISMLKFFLANFTYCLTKFSHVSSFLRSITHFDWNSNRSLYVA